MMESSKADTFVFFPTFLDQIEAINNDMVQLALYRAIAKYGLFGEMPDFSDIDAMGVINAIFVPMKYVIDEAKAKRNNTSMKRRAAAIKGGGAPKGNNNASKNKQKQTKTNKTNVNVNENVDVNVDVNVDEDVNITPISIEDRSKKQRVSFSPPTIDEVQEYILQMGYSTDAEAFIAFYESNGWMVGRNKMKSWKAAVTSWEKRPNKQSQSHPDDKRLARGKEYAQHIYNVLNSDNTPAEYEDI